MRTTAAVLAICLTLTACAGAPPPALDGTTWRLAMFQSSDDATGTLVPASSESFTLAFGRDGRVAARLDCNRGAGPWRAEPATGGGGRISIGPLATTRMMCAPDPVGDRLARDVEAVRSYRLQDGRLHLILPVDAGVYVWDAVTP